MFSLSAHQLKSEKQTSYIFKLHSVFVFLPKIKWTSTLSQLENTSRAQFRIFNKSYFPCNIIFFMKITTMHESSFFTRPPKLLFKVKFGSPQSLSSTISKMKQLLAMHADTSPSNSMLQFLLIHRKDPASNTS